MDVEMVAALPPSHQRLVLCLGWSQTLRLLRLYGGRRIYIPARGRSPFTDLLDEDACAWVRAEYGCQQWELPKIDRVFIACRNRDIVLQIKDGVDIQTLVDRYGLTRRQLRNIVTA